MSRLDASIQLVSNPLKSPQTSNGKHVSTIAENRYSTKATTIHLVHGGGGGPIFADRKVEVLLNEADRAVVFRKKLNAFTGDILPAKYPSLVGSGEAAINGFSRDMRRTNVSAELNSRYPDGKWVASSWNYIRRGGGCYGDPGL